jgi:hypothetical protein
MRILSVLLLFALSPPCLLQAQKLFRAKLDHQCIFSGGIMDSELYQYDDSSKVPEWVDEILAANNAEKNFVLVEASVENVSAVVDSTQRFLLYSIDFVEKGSRIEVYGALAHEIGHHVNLHGLKDADRKNEESEADFFMGYFFGKKGFQKPEVEAFLQKMPSSYSISYNERLKIVMSGYEKANRAIKLKGLSVDNSPQLEQLLLPTFTFKECYTTTDLPRNKFDGLATLGKVDEKIRLVLDTRGYYNRSYFSVKNGFAVVCQMEQYNRQDATIRNDRTRWLDYPVRDNFEGVLDYISTIVMPNKGYFRVFVLVVTDDVFKSTDKKVSKTEAVAWLSQGANRLPKEIAKMSFTGDHTVSALVYEFEVPESNRKPTQVCPTPLHDARTHLKKAGLGAGFGL